MSRSKFMARALKRPGLLLAALLPGGIILSSLFSSTAQAKTPSPSPPPLPPPPPPRPSKQVDLDDVLADAGLSANWRKFFLMTAAGESGFVENVYLGRPELQPPGTVLSSAVDEIGESEYQATIVAYNRHADKWDKCGWPRDRYTVAGGAFGFLAPNAVYAYIATDLRCIDPWSIYDTLEAVPMGMAMAKRILGNSRMKINNDWLDLRLGWGALERVAVPAARSAMRKKLIDRGHLKAAGISDPSWLYGKIDPLPAGFDPVALRAKLLGGRA